MHSMWTEVGQCKWTVAVLRSTCLAVGVALQLSAVRGESEPEASPDATSGTTSESGGGGTTEKSVSTTVGFVVVLFVLVLAVLMTVLLCVRHGMCSCQSKKPPPNHTPVTPVARMAGGGGSSRPNRSPLASSSSIRSSQRGGYSTHSPNTMFHHHHSHRHNHHSQHSHHHHSSPRRHNGHAGGIPVDRNMNSNSGTSIGGSSGYSPHHHNMRSASMDPPLPSNISPYPGMPFPYQPCKSPMTAYGGGGVGYTMHPQIPRTPTSASITTLSSLSTAHNQRHVMSNGGIVGRDRGGSERGEKALQRVSEDRNHAGRRERGGSERGATGEGQEVRELRGGGREGPGVEEQRRGDSGRGRGGRRDEESGGSGGAEGGSNRSGGEPTHTQRSLVPQRQVESSDSNNNANSSPLQIYSTQV